MMKDGVATSCNRAHDDKNMKVVNIYIFGSNHGFESVRYPTFFFMFRLNFTVSFFCCILTYKTLRHDMSLSELNRDIFLL